MLKLKLKRGLRKNTHEVWTLGLFSEGDFSPLSSQNADGRGFPKFAWLVKNECFLPLFCLTSQTIQCDAPHCCECMHCLFQG